MKSVIIIFGGGSLKQGLDLDLFNKIKALPNTEIWALNYSFLYFSYLVDRICWVDTNFFKKHIKELELCSLKGIKLYTKCHPKYNQIKEIVQLETSTRIQDYPDKIFTGCSGLVGFYALSLAIREKFENIFCLGNDFGAVTTKSKLTHWYQDLKPNKELLDLIGYKEPREVEVVSGGFSNTQIYMNPGNTIKPKIKEFDVFLNKGSNIYTVGWSNIKTFPMLSYEEFFEKIKSNV